MPVATCSFSHAIHSTPSRCSRPRRRPRGHAPRSDAAAGSRERQPAGDDRGRPAPGRSAIPDVAHVSPPGRDGRTGVRALVEDRARSQLDEGAAQLQRFESGFLPGRQLGHLGQHRPGRQGVRDHSGSDARRRVAAVGRRLRSSERGEEQPESRLEALRKRVRRLHARARYPLQRPLRAEGILHTAAGRPLLVDLERAKLRRGPRATGDRRLASFVRTRDVSRLGERRLECAPGNRPWP